MNKGYAIIIGCRGSRKSALAREHAKHKKVIVKSLSPLAKSVIQDCVTNEFVYRKNVSKRLYYYEIVSAVRELIKTGSPSYYKNNAFLIDDFIEECTEIEFIKLRKGFYND